MYLRKLCGIADRQGICGYKPAQPDVDLLTDTDQDFLPILAAGAGSQ